MADGRPESRQRRDEGAESLLAWGFLSRLLMVKPRVFLEGVRDELNQVSWPSREELIGSALVVFVGVVLMALFISLCDLILSKAAHWLLR